jgi:eukaryotic-like serine/threonine-protein kinase
VEGSNKAVDRVRPVAVLAEGERGQVFVGVDDVLRRRLVVKRVPSGILPSADKRTRMIQEARVLSRLDHANVLRVYGYSQQAGHDVFTFEYLEGTRLGDALAEGLDFGRKVRIASAIASVLSVAHRNGLIHGGLSAASVVLSKSGEIKVVDFDSISTILDGSRSDPRWCSPEELRGAEPTRESDMYRFGLLLQEMFGTRDRGVRALAAALLCEAPSDRLTAAAALARLNRLAQRRARRFRIAGAVLLAAIVILGATKFTLDLKRGRAAALVAKGEADARRAQANDLVAFMVQDLRPKLLSVGKLEIMDATSNKAFDYFASIDPGQISAAEAAVNVDALTQFADAQLLKNDVPAAETSVRKAIALGDAALRRHPDDLEILFARATAHRQYAMILSRKGDIPLGIVHANAFVIACAELLRRKPGEIRFLRSHAIAFGTLGYMHGRAGDADASFRNLDASVSRLRRLPQAAEGQLRTQLFDFDRHAATALIKLGRFREARQRLETAGTEIESILRREPADRELLSIRAGYDDQLASVALATGDLEAARRHAGHQLAVSRQLVAFDPARFRWIRLVVMAQRSAGTIARMDGQLDEALRHHEAAIEAASAVLARGSEQVILPRENAWSRVELARSLLAAGRSRQALLHAGLAVEVCRTMSDDLAQAVLADALLVRGDALAAEGDRDAADRAWEEALRTVERIQSRPPDPRATDTQVRALLRLGRLDGAIPLIERLAALGYRNREFEALCREKGAFINR